VLLNKEADRSLSHVPPQFILLGVWTWTKQATYQQTVLFPWGLTP